MEKNIKLTSGNKTESQCEIVNKLKAEQRILELFETKQIEKVDITYKEEPIQTNCIGSVKCSNPYAN